ncbi:MAG: hypothetical protein CR972_04265 [Candidatus Moraniibacteriota bacterium]|nr:MAG: hypothetical protein CR972_04265 [Candidatus Moranbacteria bacterium]
MVNFFKGIIVVFCGFFLLSFLGILHAQAASNSDSIDIGVTVDNSMHNIPGTPAIIDVYNITTDYMDVLIEVEDLYAGVDIDVVLIATRVDNGDSTILTYDRVPNGNAQTELDVSGLLPGTYYDFVVRYSLDGMNVFSENSNAYREKTAIEPPVIDDISSVDADSLTLDVVIDPRFTGDSMDYIVEVTNEDNGDDYTVQLTKTTSSNSVSIDIDNLDPGTQYSFRVRYGRANTNYYSDWSNSRNTETHIKTPVIDETNNVTTNSMDLLVEIDEDLSGEDVDIIVRVTNQSTGETFDVDFSENVDSDGTVTFTVDGLSAGTEYEFKVKYMRDGGSVWSDWSQPKSERTDYIDNNETQVVICHNDRTITISSTELQDYLDEGAYEGECQQGGGTTPPETPTDPVDTVSGDTIDVVKEDEEEDFKEEIREVIAPEETKNIYQTAGVIGATAGSIAALAGSAVPLFTAMPGAFSSSIFLKFIELFGIIGRRKEERNWGVVFDSVTRMPIPAAKIVLSDVFGKEMATTYSDKDGRFGFLASPGKYKLSIFKKDYEMVTDIDADDLYGNVYNGGVVEMSEEHIILVNIAMKSLAINWEEYAQKKVKQYRSSFSMFKKYFFLTLYILGFVSTCIITWFYPNTFNFVVLGIYIILFIYQVFFKKKKYGSIETDEGKPIPFAVVSLHDENSNEKKRFAVTDAIGRYYLLADNGKYKMKAKGQPVSGEAFEKQGDVKVHDGIVRKDIIV